LVIVVKSKINYTLLTSGVVALKGRDIPRQGETLSLGEEWVGKALKGRDHVCGSMIPPF
jgi:hypothetical protein